MSAHSGRVQGSNAPDAVREPAPVVPAKPGRMLTYPTRTEVESLASRHRLALPERMRGAGAGELSGKRTGASIEFQDRKDYSPGDDPRAIDWRAFARTDRMTVKLYREEITPVVDVIVDTSASMASTPAKAQRRTELVHLFELLGRHAHARVRLHDLGRRMAPVRSALELVAGASPSAEAVEQEDPLPGLRASRVGKLGGVKIFVTDLLFPFAPPELVACFTGSDRVVLVQILSPFEADPAGSANTIGLGPSATVRLEEAETNSHLDLRLDPPTVAAYLARLNALRDETSRRIRAIGGAFAVVRADDNLTRVAELLVRAGALSA